MGNNSPPTFDLPDARFRVMGSTAHVVVIANDPEPLLDFAQSRLDQLESRWSRFRADSDISRLNRADGAATSVHRDTVRLVRHALAGAVLTDGDFAPLVLGCVAASGYDRSFVRIEIPEISGMTPIVPSSAAVMADAETNTVALPPGAGFDPGGIGKGLAADIVTDELLARGAHGALVNVGGDIRVAGQGPEPAGWRIRIADEVAGGHRFDMLIADGAVSTSTNRRRRWSTTSGVAHHLIDPSTGRPSQASVRLVSVISGQAWQAEVLATSIAARGLDPSTTDRLGPASAIVTMDDSTEHRFGPLNQVAA